MASEKVWVVFELKKKNLELPWGSERVFLQKSLIEFLTIILYLNFFFDFKFVIMIK